MRNRPSTRTAAQKSLSARSSTLWLGFTGLLLLMAISAFDSGRSLRNLGTASASLRKETRQRDNLLDQVRTDIFRSGTIMRDYLIEVDDGAAQTQKIELERTRGRISDTLRTYEQKLPEAERPALADVRHHVDTYWNSLAAALDWNAIQRMDRGKEFLRDVILPGRAAVVELVRQATALNEHDLETAEDSLEAIQSRVTQRVTIISIAVLVAGVILTAFSIRRIVRLERQAEARYQEVVEARGELRKLSGVLVTAQEEERRKLSRELHDEVGQEMTAMLVELGRLETAPRNGPVYHERMATVRGMAEKTVGMVRNMALMLRPSMLDDLGLVPALRWQAREVTRRTGLKVKVISEEITEDLPDAHRTCVYRFVQEALHNCTKHAQANEVRVVVRLDQKGLCVSVEDDGTGFNPDQEKGLGLLGMAERAEHLGGGFSIDSKPGRGSVLSMGFPQIVSQPALRESLT